MGANWKYAEEDGDEAIAHTAPGFRIHWTSSVKYMPNLLNSIGPIELNRVYGLREEDSKDNLLSTVVCSICITAHVLEFRVHTHTGESVK